MTNLQNLVKINSEGIRISSNGGATWSTALDGRGINIGTVYTGLLNTDKIIIGNSDNPSFRWDKAGISAYKSNESEYDLKTYVRYDQYGLYGIKNNEYFVANSLQDVKDKAYFAVTWDGFFIKNSYEDGGRVSITSDNDFQVIDGSDIERIKIGSLGIDSNTGDRIYGINISNKDGDSVLTTNNDGDVTITGTINATGGNFSGVVNVGPESQNHIIIDGNNASIASSNYQDGAGSGWLINKDGDAYFMNITARGAIKTAVFEYAEIQAVGGVFIFRPSSTIKSARIAQNGTDLILKVEKPQLFAKIKYNEVDSPTGNPKQHGWYERTSYSYASTEDTTITSGKTYYEREVISHSWCKISNYTNDGGEPDISSTLKNNGLTHVYESISVNLESKEITLSGAAVIVSGQNAITTLTELEGGALIDMGRSNLSANYDNGIHNYGIGVNSSDNTVNLPARSISLFETEINEQDSIKVSYKYKGILGTLPVMQYSGPNAQVAQLYHDYMESTQGIYTDNMYIGDASHYIAFYTQNNQKKLRIKGADILFTYDDGQGTITEQTLEEKIDTIETTPGPAGESAITVRIESNVGNEFIYKNEQATLTCTVIQGSSTDITNQVSQFIWKKRNRLGQIDNNWTRTTAVNYITINTSDVDFKAVFECEVEF